MTQKRTANGKTKFLAALTKHDGNISRAAKAVGVNRKTYHEWYKLDPDFAIQAEEVFESVKDELESLLLDAGYGRMKEKGNMTAILAFLNARAKDRGYGSHRQEHSGPDGGPIRHKLEELSDEQLRSIAGRGRSGAGT